MIKTVTTHRIIPGPQQRPTLKGPRRLNSQLYYRFAVSFVGNYVELFLVPALRLSIQDCHFGNGLVVKAVNLGFGSVPGSATHLLYKLRLLT